MTLLPNVDELTRAAASPPSCFRSSTPIRGLLRCTGATAASSAHGATDGIPARAAAGAATRMLEDLLPGPDRRPASGSDMGLVRWLAC
jgi:hypothetical protein